MFLVENKFSCGLKVWKGFPTFALTQYIITLSDNILLLRTVLIPLTSMTKSSTEYGRLEERNIYKKVTRLHN